MSHFLPKALILSILMVSLSGTTFLIPKQNVGFGTDQALVNIGAKSGVTGLDRALPDSSKLQQYTAGGHVLGFRENGVVIASGSHSLKVEFVNAQSVAPVTDGALSSSAKDQRGAPPLAKVTYRNLWDGVSVVYERTEAGVVKSTYYVQAGGAKAALRVGKIHLRYNVPVRVDKSGDLVLTLATGEMRETRPLAWQETEGGRVSVDVGYRLLGEREVGIRAGDYDPRYDLVIDPVLIWNTFLGGADNDYGVGVATDANGNVYAIGTSAASWGDPIRAFTPGGEYTNDAFVAKLDKNGNLLWNTFLGGSGSEEGLGIAVDSSGNVYVTGFSSGTWGGGSFAGEEDAFVAKLNTNGTLQWNTFLGGSSYDEGYAIALDTDGNPCVTGDSYGTWGTPRVTPAANTNAFVAKLDKVSGTLTWNTFLGGDYDDNGSGIAVDTGGNVLIAGHCESSWGTNIIDGFVGDDEDEDTFVAKLDPNGYYLWNTFMGSASGDATGYGIAVDTKVGDDEGVYIVGVSDSDWGVYWENPIRAFDGEEDNAFVAKLNTNGVRQWHTFLGGVESDSGNGIAADASGHVYVTGWSGATWGSPQRPFSGIEDAFAARLDANGALQWNTFLGGDDVNGYVNGFGIAADTSGNCFVIGHSGGTWGSPKRSFTAGEDAFVAKFGNNIRVDFNSDKQEDLLWRYQGNGAYQGWNVVWYMNQGSPLSLKTPGMNQLNGSAQDISYSNPMCVANSPNPTPDKEYMAPLEAENLRASGAIKSGATPLDYGGGRSRVPARSFKNPMEAGNSLGPKPGMKSRNVVLYDHDLTPRNKVRLTEDKGVEGISAQEDTLKTGTVSPGMMEIAYDWDGEAYLPKIEDTAWEINGLGYFNADEQTDVLWRYYGSGYYQGWNVLWHMEGTTIKSHEYLPTVWDTNWRIAATGDFNGDDKFDILWRYYGSGVYQGWNLIWFMDGTSISGYAYLPGVSDTNWKIDGTGDFNADGKLDILWRYYGSGYLQGWDIIWYMDGTAIRSQENVTTIWDTSWRIDGVGDFNDDGRADMLWRYYGSGYYQGWNIVWFMDGTTIKSQEKLRFTIWDLNWRIVNR